MVPVRLSRVQSWQIFLSLLCLPILASCVQSEPVRQEAYVFGTRVEVVALGAQPQRVQAALDAVLRDFDRLHRDYHPWQNSELTALNRCLSSAPSCPIKPEMATLLQAAQKWEQLSDGLFNPAIGGLVAAWGFHAEQFAPRLPEPALLARWRETRPRMADLEIAGEQVRSRNPAVQLDFGGLAKGHALDRAAAILLEHHVTDALINIGGNVMALGSKHGQPWQVGIQHPRGDGTLATLSLYHGEAIGTSGDYQRYFELEGVRYSHLIDPRTAAPGHATQALTVLVTPRVAAGLVSDVTSKPLFLAAGEWPAMARRLGVAHVLRVASDGHISLSLPMRERLRWREGMGDGAEVIK